MSEPDYRSLSFWLDSLAEPLEPRPALSGPEDVDVAIVGGGYSGLWTAYYLTRLDPDLRIAIVEAEIAGFGASGRNGGWCVGALSGLEGLLARPARRAEGVALQRAIFDTVDEVGRVAREEGIECDYHKGGALHAARTPAQLEAARHHVEQLESWGFGQEDYRLLSPAESAQRARIADCLGTLYSSHCAALHPAKLARGLAHVVEAAGVRVFERSPARELTPGRVRTEDGELRARFVVRATEAYTARLPGLERRLVPLHSMMIATEPLSAEMWQEIGLEERDTFGDGRRIVIYGQRTADGRLAFGGRAGYRFASGIEDHFRADDPRFEAVREALVQLFPVVESAKITHRWGGPLGVPRNWRPSLGLDRTSGMAWLGGYVGEGVAATNLAGRTLAELIAGEATERTRLAWVDQASSDWEPEPLRWIAVKGLTGIGASIDSAEQRNGRTPLLRSKLFGAFVSR